MPTKTVRKALIGQEDFSTGAGTFSRSKSDGSSQSLTKIGSGALTAGNLYNILVVDGVKYPLTAAGINAADSDLGASGGEIIVPSDVTAIDAQVSISANHTLSVMRQITVANPVLVGLYGCIRGIAGSNKSKILAAANTAFTSLVRSAAQDGTQEAFYIKDITLDGNDSGTTTSFSIGVLDMTGVFVPGYAHNVIIHNYTGAPGLYAKQSTATDGGGMLDIENVWVNPNSNSVGIKIHHTAGDTLVMQGYRLRHVTVENTGSANCVEIVNAAADKYLRTVMIDGLHTSGGTGITLLVDGLKFGHFQQIIGANSTGPVVRIANNSNNADLVFEGVYNIGGASTVIDDLLNSKTITGNVAYYVSTPTGAPTDIAFYGPVLPGATGESFGSASARWDANLRNASTRRIKADGGTTLVSGDFSLSAGWGTTASVGSIRGTDQWHELVITSAGTGQAANPTLTMTYKDGTWTTAPIVSVNRQDFGSQATVTFTVTTQSATQYVLTFNGTPVAGDTYKIRINVGGI